jgi:hypothetical protein
MSKFDWDDSNREKCACRVPGNPYERETRFRAIGRSSEGRPLFVVFTMREKNGELYVRPISARYRHRGEGDEETVPEIR